MDSDGKGICGVQGNYDSASHGRKTTKESIKQDNLFLSVNDWYYDCGVNLADLKGWNRLRIHYEGGEGRKGANGLVTVFLNDSEKPLVSKKVNHAPNLASIMIGTGGQYDYTGEWVIDDVSVTASK